MPDLQHRWSPDEQVLSRALHLAVDGTDPAAPGPTAPRPVATAVDLGRRRRWALVAVPALAACLVTALVVGIGLATRDEPGPVASPTPAPALQDPAVLVGTWSADIVAQPDADVTATFDADDVRLVDQGCETGFWTDTHPDGLLLLLESPRLGTGNDPCAVLGRQPWMTDIQRTSQFVVQDADHVRLLDRMGHEVAALVRQGGARPSEPPVGVVALPAGLAAPTQEELIGTWYELGLGVAGRSISFTDDVWTYSQSVPCNSREEPFALSPIGGLAHLRDPNSRVRGCDPRLPGWLPSDVSRVGLDGDVLVLLDTDAREVARLDRGGESPGTVIQQVQGDWEVVGMAASSTVDGLGLRIDDEWLRHDGNAVCNTADEDLRLSGDGWVVGSRRAQVGGCEPGGEELLPGLVERVELEGDQLVVLGLGGDELRRFVRAEP